MHIGCAEEFALISVLSLHARSQDATYFINEATCFIDVEKSDYLHLREFGFDRQVCIWIWGWKMENSIKQKRWLNGDHSASLISRKSNYPAGYILGCVGLSILLFLGDLTVPLGVAYGMLYVLVVICTLCSPRWELTLGAAIVSSILTLAGLALSPSGSSMWIVVTNRMLSLLAIWVTAFVCLKQKKSEQAIVEAKMELINAKESAELANKTKSEFLANMSHEIRTPMTAILGFTDILLGNVSNPESVESVQTIKRNGESLIGLINDILDLSKIESGKLNVEQIECSAHQVVVDVSSLMKVRAQAKGLQLDVRFDGPIPEKICTDPARLRQVLINIVGNAIKFTETGSIQIITRLENRAGDEPHLRFDIVDNGIGIAEDKIENLFLPFTQADSSTTRQFGGTGLGLTICERLVELLGGSISVTSTLEKGSIFSVTVSTGSLDNVTMVNNFEELVIGNEDSGAVQEASAALSGCRILFAEDGPDNQRLISFLLKKAGAEVTVADNGKIAVDYALAAIKEARPFDVILMDLQMPVLDGYAATRTLRNLEYQNPIIALTAHAMSTDRQKCLDAGCDDYASKPIDKQKLIEMVASYAKGEIVASDAMYAETKRDERAPKQGTASQTWLSSPVFNCISPFPRCPA